MPRDQDFAKLQPAPGATAGSGQPHFGVAICAPGATTRTKGAAMFDTGAMVTLVSQGWASAHGLQVTRFPAGKQVTVAAFNGQPQPMEGTTDMIM